MKYLVCGVDDESYADSTVFDIVDSYKEAMEICISNIMHYFAIEECDKIEIKNGMEVKHVNYFGQASTKVSLSYSYGAFYVNYIIELPDNINSSDYICIWHHAYDGVDFKIAKIGTFEECKYVMEEEARKVLDEIGKDLDDEDSYDWKELNQICIDTDTEWEVWDIVNIEEIIRK
jgi:hypothetical protein